MSDQEFFAKADADPNSVYLVTIYPEERTGVFSTKAKADAWVETFPADCPAVVSTWVIDEPDYGNVPQSKIA